MRLLYACSDFGIRPNGVKGASIHVRSILRALRDLGHETHWLSPYMNVGNGFPATPAGPAEIIQPAGVSALRARLRNHGLDGDVSGEIRSLLFNDRAIETATEAMSRRPPDAVIERLSLFGHAGVDLAEAFDCPLVMEVNAILSREAARFRNLRMAGLAERIERFVLDRADAIVVVSDALRVALVEMGIAGEKVHVVPNGVDLDLFSAERTKGKGSKSGASASGGATRRGQHPIGDLRERLGLSDRVVVLFVGSLKPWHGVDVLLEALALLGDTRDAQGRLAHALIVGVGPEEQNLRKQVAELGIAHRVTFVGGIAHEHVPAHVACSDIAVAPYRCMDGFYFSPVKLFEYMAAGRCVIATGLGQIAEVIADGKNGLLCPGDDADALAKRLGQVIADADLRERLGRAARSDVALKHTWTHTARQVARVVESVRRPVSSPVAPSANANGASPQPVGMGDGVADRAGSQGDADTKGGDAS